MNESRNASLNSGPTGTIAMSQGTGADGGGGNVMVEPLPDLDPTRELATKITGPFTIAAVGDLTIMRPIGRSANPDLQAALQIIRDADVGFANMESNISDPPHYTGPLRGFMGVKEVAADIRSWGITLVNKAGNHGFDSGPEGLLATVRLLEDAGVQFAGSGRNLTEARSARFVELAHGRVGAVGMYLTGFLPNQGAGATSAADSWGNHTPARPGQNTLHVDQAYVVTQEQLDTLRKIQDSLHVLNDEITTPRPPPQPAAAGAERSLRFGGSTYKAGDALGTISHEMNAEDLRQQLRNIKGGKQYADFMIASAHVHQGKWVAEHFPEETSTPDFLVELAHKAIDNGADMFAGHGPHALRGIEIYQGRPIFYGLGQFVRQSDWRTPTRPDFDAFGTTPETTDMTPAELGVLRTAGPGFRHPAMYDSIIAVSRFNDGKLQEIRLYPVDLGFDRPLSQVGTPALAHGEFARRVLQHVQKVSRRFGTNVQIDGDVGVIRMPGDASEPNRSS